jgi:hypothetical protein
MPTRNHVVRIGLPLLLSAAILTGATNPVTAREPRSPDTAQATASDRAAIDKGIETYIHSINAADTQEGATVFNTTPGTVFIHPRGTERGWNAVAVNFYGQTMGQTFTKRTLTLTGTPQIQFYGNAAVTEFEWDFVAMRRENGQPLHSSGRESQTWIKLPKLGWRIVEVHYSGPPQTGAGQGF